MQDEAGRDHAGGIARVGVSDKPRLAASGQPAVPTNGVMSGLAAARLVRASSSTGPPVWRRRGRGDVPSWQHVGEADQRETTRIQADARS